MSVTMRQSRAAGDKLFVDYAGDGVPVVIDRLARERRTAQIFVAVLGASNFTYAQATRTQGLADWISAHAGAFAAIGGVPALLVPRQHQDRGHQGVPLRPANQSHVCGDGGAIRHRRLAGAAEEAARQGSQPPPKTKLPHNRRVSEPVALAHDRRHDDPQFAPKTQHDYVQRVKNFAAFLG